METIMLSILTLFALLVIVRSIKDIISLRRQEKEQKRRLEDYNNDVRNL